MPERVSVTVGGRAVLGRKGPWKLLTGSEAMGPAVGGTDEDQLALEYWEMAIAC